MTFRYVHAVVPFVAMTLFGCGSGSRSSADGPNINAGLDAAEASAGSDAARIESDDAAVINGAPISREALWRHLAEYGGGQILEELVLDRRLERELQRRAMRVTEQDIENEKDNLLFFVLQGTTEDADEAARIIDATRRTRGLGPARYQALLERNAMLRRLVRDEVMIVEEELQTLFDVKHGPKVRARIIVVATERDAASLRAEIVADGAGRSEFAQAALDHSLDATSAAGGLIEVFSTLDPAYPSVVRLALEQIEPGELTPVIGLEAGFAFLMLEERLPADDLTLEEARESLQRELRLRQERIRMQQLAQELVETTRVMPVDQSVGWSWRSRPQAR